tara:strand:+ start:2875 stop:3453 length:579 start_codon:yes stop_codon:yes gene_type:complete
MLLLIAGLLLFMATHSISIFNPGLRNRMVASYGEKQWKLAYSIISIASFIMIIYGYGAARLDPVWLWQPPVALRHLALLLTVPAFVLLAAAYVPGNRIKAKLGHPMYVSVKIWAFAHLLANGTLADVLLFGSFLAWAIAGFAVSRRRDRLNQISRPAGTTSKDMVTVIVGLVSWAVFAMFLHTLLIGVNPLP